MNKELIWEAIKEPLRELVLAIIPFLLQHFQAINTEWAVIVYLILRGVDAWLHQVGKAKELESVPEKTLAKLEAEKVTSIYTTGLTRF